MEENICGFSLSLLGPLLAENTVKDSKVSLSRSGCQPKLESQMVW